MVWYAEGSRGYAHSSFSFNLGMAYCRCGAHPGGRDGAWGQILEVAGQATDPIPKRAQKQKQFLGIHAATNIAVTLP